MKKLMVLTVIVISLVSGLVADARPFSEPLNQGSRYNSSTRLYIKDGDYVKLTINSSYIKTHPVQRTVLNFWSPTGTYHVKEWAGAPPSGFGFVRLNCNGTYLVEMYHTDGTISETKSHVIDRIVNPVCDSYPEGSPADFVVTTEEQPDGKIKMKWDPYPNADHYDVYKDGDKVGSTTDTSWDIDSPGDYNVIAKDGSGDDDTGLGVSDTYTTPPNYGGVDNGGSNGGCDACKWLTDALACPAWDEYMGDLTNVIKNALPPPPDWDAIANTFVDKFANYFGDVPAVPTKLEIDNKIRPSMPNVNTSAPDAGIVPTVPSDFNNGAIQHDITAGEQIPIIDGSSKIEIYEPDKYINSDDAGVMVMPNDSRNHSDGIKAPDTIVTEPAPAPTDTGNNIPAVDLPVPNVGDGTVPTPNDGDYIIPIPTERGRGELEK